MLILCLTNYGNYMEVSKMVYDYAQMKMTIPMDYFLDMFVGHYDAEKLDAVYYLENHKWYYMDECWTYDDEVIAMQDYMQDMKDYYISIWKLKRANLLYLLDHPVAEKVQPCV